MNAPKYQVRIFAVKAEDKGHTYHGEGIQPGRSTVSLILVMIIDRYMT